MRYARPTALRLSVLLGCLILGIPHALWATDAETAALEAYAQCHAQPYLCAPGALMTPEEQAQDRLCDGLTPHMALIASKIIHKETLDAADQAAQQTWNASCRDWEQTRRLRTPQKSPPPAAFTVPAPPVDFTVPAPPRITTRCWTDAWWGVTHGHISTTCTTD